MPRLQRTFALALLLPACVVAKSVGDDPESAGLEPETAEGGSAESSSTTTPGSSVSVSSSQSGGGDDTCDASGCGGASEATSDSGGGPVGSESTYDPSATTTGIIDCGYDPPTIEKDEFIASCWCETCEFHWDHISEEDANTLAEDESICPCLCSMSGCGEVNGYGEVAGGESTGEPPDTDSGTTSSTSG